MGKIKQGAFGGFTGKVGNLVGCTWKGIPYMRTQSTHRKTTGTTQQISGSTQLSQNNHSFSTHRIPGICGKADCFQRRHVLCDEKCLGRQ